MTEVLEDAATILGFDPFEPGFRVDPYPRYEQLRAGGPIWRTTGGLLLASAHRTVSRIFRDQRFGHHSGVRGPVPFRRPRSAATGTTRWFVVMDPPDHTRLRRLIGKAFTPRLVETLRPRVAAIADRLLAEAAEATPPGGEIDLVSAFAYPLSLTVIGEMLGVPAADHEQLKRWGTIATRGIDPDFVMSDEEIDQRGRAFAEMNAYFAELTAHRRAHPTDDLLGQLAALEEQGDVLTQDELMGICSLLLVAGHETVVDLLGNGTLALLRHPDQARFLREHPEAAAPAIDELLRFDAPVQMIMRTALVDTEVDGVAVSRGDMVMLMIGAAHRDPAAYERPDRLELTRRGSERHLAFGAGIHYCLGAPLGRLEGQVALTTLLRRMPGLELTGRPLTYRPNLMARGLAALPVRPDGNVAESSTEVSPCVC